MPLGVIYCVLSCGAFNGTGRKGVIDRTEVSSLEDILFSFEGFLLECLRLSFIRCTSLRRCDVWIRLLDKVCKTHWTSYESFFFKTGLGWKVFREEEVMLLFSFCFFYWLWSWMLLRCTG